MWEPLEIQEKSRFIDDIDWFQPTRESSVLIQSYGKFSPPCYHQEDQDWSFDTQYPLDIDEQQESEENQEGMVNIRTTVGTGRAPTSSLEDSKTQPNTPENITAPPNSPEYVSTIHTPSPAVIPFKPDTPSFTAAAHQAVVDLFPEIVDTCIFRSGFSHVFGIPEEAPSPNITISPRHLSKLKLPSTPPPKSVFDHEGLENYHDFSRFISDQEFIDSDEAAMSDNDMPSPSPASTPTSFISRPLPDAKELLREQNRLLLRWRSEGISYRTIKKKLGINEAESTLRGRLRTLTKPKSERLRKPQWTEEDIELLLEVVDPSTLGVKWKQVSDTIVSLGGSYRFGPSTCKKQYLKLVEEGRASPLLGCGTVVGKRSRIEFKVEN
ncbi:hypothetical protein DFP73DRAFT_600929 [Morchella snyderi]|nr:hypothetical protein DFP73DRAFT_600929 [Morchella snyderi]